MPHKPYWFRELTEIERRLESLEDSVVDRRAIEYVFRVSQTEAGRLLRRMGCVLAGHAKVVPRYQVQEWLRQVRRSGGYDTELHRVERLDEKLKALAKAKAGARVILRPDPAPRTMTDLPPGVTLSPGCLEVRFFGAQDLLGRLFGLAQAISQDFRRFEEMLDK
jgi:hypothetical protein